MDNYKSTVISQYGNSSILSQLMDNYNQYIDPAADLDNFYKYIWNVDTATGNGLDIWGRIVGISRYLAVDPNPIYFGFSNGSGFAPFNQAPFYSNGGASGTYALSDEAFRLLIMIKALTNISETTIPALNQILTNLFLGRGQAYVIDNGGMSMTMHFEFSLAPFEIAMLATSGAIAHPAGVLVSITHL
jgi:hypothetical protein